MAVIYCLQKAAVWDELKTALITVISMFNDVRIGHCPGEERLAPLRWIRWSIVFLLFT